MTMEGPLADSPLKHEKDGKGKRRWSLLPLEVMREILAVWEHGAGKYGDENWKKCTNWDRYYNAMMRHIEDWRCGEKLDKDSKLHHLAHIIVNAWILLWSEKEHISHDR